MELSPQPIARIAEELGLGPNDYVPYGRGKAKLELSLLERAPRGKGRLVLVTAINPTPAGEGKTTTSIGLAMGLRRLGKNAVLALREPSLGPVFGVKGGGTGGGKASLTPADDINLHFTGDIHAITTAHNLLSALVDNQIYFGEPVGEKGPLDPRLVTWGRALDMNDRFLRRCLVGLGGKAHGVPREERFDITAASEVMAILALATSHADLEARLGRIVVGQSTTGHAITAGDLGAAPAMTAVLRDALQPNLVQTLEGGPAIVHCGPFANIAHGCNSVLATKLAMQLGDYAITEAGFGFDLGGEKFLDIKCRQAGEVDHDKLARGIQHLEKHLETADGYGLKPIVALNVFPNDTAEEIAIVERAVGALGARLARSEVYAKGGEGGIELARAVVEVVDETDAAPPEASYVYELADAPEEKIRKIARTVYGAKDVVFAPAAEKSLERIKAQGGARLPICMAKTQLSLTDDPTIPGRPREFTITVRDVRLSAGAGFLVPLTGEMMTMPGLPRVPASRQIRLQPDGRIKGLMQND